MTQKARNLNMFAASSQDLPLFSGTAQTVKASAPAPAPDPWQQTSFTDQIPADPIKLTPWPGMQIQEPEPQPAPQVHSSDPIKAARREQAERTLSDVTDQIEQGYAAISQAMEQAARADLDHYFPELTETMRTINQLLNKLDAAGMHLLSVNTQNMAPF